MCLLFRHSCGTFSLLLLLRVARRTEENFCGVEGSRRGGREERRKKNDGGKRRRRGGGGDLDVILWWLKKHSLLYLYSAFRHEFGPIVGQDCKIHTTSEMEVEVHYNNINSEAAEGRVSFQGLHDDSEEGECGDSRLSDRDRVCEEEEEEEDPSMPRTWEARRTRRRRIHRYNDSW